MANLDEVVGSLLTQINRGRIYSDLATIEVAKRYREDPLLSHFPIPHMAIEEIEVELRFAFARPPMERVIATREMRNDILEEIRKMIRDMPDIAKELINVLKERMEWQKVWHSREGHLIENIAGIVPVDQEIDIDGVSRAIGNTIENELTGTLIDQRSNVTVAMLRRYQKEVAPKLRQRLIEHAHRIIAGRVGDVEIVGDESMQVLVTAAELQTVPPEKISSVKLKIHESDRTWARLNDDDQEPKNLVPH